MDTYISLFSVYLKDKKHCSQNTIMSYLLDIKQFILFLQNEHIRTDRIDKINRTNIMSYILFLQKSKKSASTILRNVASLRSFYKYLISQNIVKDDPTVDIETPKIEKKLPTVILFDEVEVLLKQPSGNSPKSKRDKAMLELLYATGIRASELIALKIDDLNLDAMYIKCDFAGKERIIPLGNYAILSLKTYLSEARNELIKDTNERTLFLNNNGNPMTRQGFWKIVKFYADKANIDTPITPQTLRHSFAAHLVANGADINSVKEMLGHSDISSTQVYIQFQQNKLKEVYASAHPRCK